MSAYLPLNNLTPDTDLMLSIAQSNMRSALQGLRARAEATTEEPEED